VLSFAATVLMLFLAVRLILDLLLILLVLFATVHRIPSCAHSGAADFHPILADFGLPFTGILPDQYEEPMKEV